MPININQGINSSTLPTLAVEATTSEKESTSINEQDLTNDSPSFAQALSAAKKAMEIDVAIAEAKEAGEKGLSLYSKRAYELGVGKARPTTSGTSVEGLNCSEELNTYFNDAGNTYGVDPKLLKSIAKAESNFRSDAVSKAGAIGVMQLMPSTASGLGVSNSYDPYQNIMGGAKYIAKLLGDYNNDLTLALAAYNAGSGNVNKYGGVPPFSETQNYVAKVLSYYSS